MSHICITPGVLSFIINFDPSSEKDVVMYRVHAVHESNPLLVNGTFTPTNDTLISYGPDTCIQHSVDVGGVWYIRIAAEDAFGADNLTYSPPFTTNVATKLSNSLLDGFSDIDFVINDSLFTFGASAATTLSVTAGTILRQGVTYTIAAQTLPSAANKLVKATLNAGVATLSAVGMDILATLPNEVIIAVTSSGLIGGKYVAYVRQATAVALEGALVTEASIDSAKIKDLSASKITSGTMTANVAQVGALTLGTGTQYGSIQTYDFDNKSTGIKILDGDTPSIVVKGGTIESGTLKTSSAGTDRVEISGDTDRVSYVLADNTLVGYVGKPTSEPILTYNSKPFIYFKESSFNTTEAQEMAAHITKIKGTGIYLFHNGYISNAYDGGNYISYVEPIGIQISMRMRQAQQIGSWYTNGLSYGVTSHLYSNSGDTNLTGISVDGKVTVAAESTSELCVGVRGTSAGGSYYYSQPPGFIGVEGIGETYDFYAAGSSIYGPFTGSHDAITSEDLMVGDVVYDEIIVAKRDVASCVSRVRATTTPYVKSVLGVVNKVVGSINRNYPAAFAGNEFDLYLADQDGAKICLVNSVGEGQINVCKDGGNIEAGDYICSSSRTGKGMKQDDDLLHNYTVAKAREACTWAPGEDDIRMIACTYHCG